MEEGKNRKMEVERKPLQGVKNIILFNWHFYVVAVVLIIAMELLGTYMPTSANYIIQICIVIVAFVILFSLLISHWVYDKSSLYQLTWLHDGRIKTVLNMHAGFDEITPIIQRKIPTAKLVVSDFYNSNFHTEVSIKRARKAAVYKSSTVSVSTKCLPFESSEFDVVIGFLSIHEIREKQERIVFFQQLHRVTNANGQIIVTEHLRDWKNFMAYNIGFLHFHSRKIWLETFEQAGLVLKQEIKTTPFITTFILEKYGNTP